MNALLSPLSRLVAAYLVTRAGARASRTAISRALSGITTEGELGAGLDDLERRGLVAADARGNVSLTAPGRAEALAFLGLSERAPRPTWRKLRAGVLPLLALGIAPADAPRARSPGDALVAAVLQKHERLPTKKRAPARAALDALAWRALGVESDAPFTREAALEAVLRRAVGGARFRGSRAGARLLAAKHARASRSDPEALGLALLRAFVAAPAEPAEPAPTAPPDLSAFAARVVEAAHAARSGRFGDEKVFISHVHRAMGDRSLPLDAFKERLVAAQRAGLVELCRADLVGAMPDADVRASEVRNLGAAFHFVRAARMDSR